MTKHALNAFLATSVAFINEVARLCEAVRRRRARRSSAGSRASRASGPDAYLSPGRRRSRAARSPATCASSRRLAAERGGRHPAPRRRAREQRGARPVAAPQGRGAAGRAGRYAGGGRPGSRVQAGDRARCAARPPLELCAWLADAGRARAGARPRRRAPPGGIARPDRPAAAAARTRCAGADVAVMATAVARVPRADGRTTSLAAMRPPRRGRRRPVPGAALWRRPADRVRGRGPPRHGAGRPPVTLRGPRGDRHRGQPGPGPGDRRAPSCEAGAERPAGRTRPGAELAATAAELAARRAFRGSGVAAVAADVSRAGRRARDFGHGGAGPCRGSTRPREQRRRVRAHRARSRTWTGTPGSRPSGSTCSAPSLMCRACPAGPAARRGYGKIVNLSGGGATAPLPRFSAYAASKAAVVRLHRDAGRRSCRTRAWTSTRSRPAP